MEDMNKMEYMSNIEYHDILKSLKQRFQSKPFAFGFGGYEPFVYLSKDPCGPMYDLMFSIGDELNCEVKPIACTWQNFQLKLCSGEIVTMADPIMPSLARPFSIIPYVKITINVLVYDVQYKAILEQDIERLPIILREMSRAEIIRDDDAFNKFYSQFCFHLGKIAQIGRGFAVMQGNTDENTLNYFEIKISKKYKGANIASSVLDGVEKGYTFLVDMPSARKAFDSLQFSDIQRLRMVHLFGNQFPSRIIAGFPVDRTDFELQRFLLFHTTDVNGLARSAISKLNHVTLDRSDLKLIPIEEIHAYISMPKRPLSWSTVSGFGLDTIKGSKKVFLNYAKEDAKRVKDLYKELTTKGFRIWLDEFALLGGQYWERELRNAIRESALVLICISKKSTQKQGVVQKEIRWAIQVAEEMPEGKAFVIPVLLEPCEIPSALSELQYVRLYESDGFDRLVKSLEYHIIQE